MTTSAPPDVLTTEQFFRLLWPNVDDTVDPVRGHINLWQLQGRSSDWVDVQDMAKAAAIVERRARRHDVYAATALIDLAARKRQAASENRGRVDLKAIRGTNATATAIPGVWLDLDVGGPEHGPAHKNTNLPPTYEDALALLAEAIPLEPTIIIDSGHGIYAWWLFQALWQFDNEQDREEAADLVYRLQRTLQERARAHGWEIDGTADLARVLRPPGTINHKLEPVPVRAIKVDEARRYQPDDFDRYLIDVEWHSVVADPISLPDDLKPVNLDALPLPPYIKKLIMVGNEWQEDRNAWRYGSRSQAVWRVVNEMLKANLPDETIASVLLDTRFSISENPLEKGKRARAFVAREIGKARKLRDREVYRASSPTTPSDAPPAAGEPQTYEEAMAELARMRRVALDRSDQLEDVRTVLAETRAEQQGLRDRIEHLEIFEGIVQKIDEVLSRPDAECSSDDKVFNIAAARWLPFHRSKRLANGQQPTLSLGYLSKVIGMPKRRLSRCLDRSSSDDPAAGAPYRKNLIRKPVIDPETGLQARDDKNKPRWESSLEIIPWRDSPRETLTAAATYTMPERPKRGGSQAASDARWGRCQRHDNTEVRIKGYCPDCGRIVGERMLSVEEFDVLNVQIGHSEPTAPTVPGSDSIGVQNGHSDGGGATTERLNVQVVDSAPAPFSLLNYAAPRPPGPPERCPAPGCGALEFKQRPDGSWRCLRSGHDPRASGLLPMVAGGSE